MRDVFVKYLGFDRAVVFSVLLKSWQAGAGLFGLILIGFFFDAEVQGFYFTFASLVALQSFVELGLYLVISTTASREWSRLVLASDGSIEGDPQALSRLVSLGRFVFKWYAVAALAFVLLAGAGGYWFLGGAQTPVFNWRGPWLLHVVFSGLLLWCLPFLSLLEACDQVARVAKFRLLQGVASNLAFWTAIAGGANLWAAPIFSAMSAMWCVYYLIVTRWQFFSSFLQVHALPGLNWKQDILPMQWRLAVQGMMSYFVFALFTPVMFYYHGAAVAVQMGMTLQAVTAFQAISSMWFMAKAPRFGILAAQRRFDQLDSEWRHACLVAVCMMALGSIVLVGAVVVLNALVPRIAERVLPPLAFLMLSAGAVFSLWTQGFSVYLRAHNREVLTAAAMISGSLMGVLVWQLGARLGPVGASAGYLFVMSAVTFPFVYVIWRRASHSWH